MREALADRDVAARALRDALDRNVETARELRDALDRNVETARERETLRAKLEAQIATVAACQNRIDDVVRERDEARARTLEIANELTSLTVKSTNDARSRDGDLARVVTERDTARGCLAVVTEALRARVEDVRKTNIGNMRLAEKLAKQESEIAPTLGWLVRLPCVNLAEAQRLVDDEVTTIGYVLATRTRGTEFASRWSGPERQAAHDGQPPPVTSTGPGPRVKPGTPLADVLEVLDILVGEVVHGHDASGDVKRDLVMRMNKVRG